MRFTEIEHKFVVPESFDLAAFGRAVAGVGPSHHFAVHVRDRYYVTTDGRRARYVIRHRYDAGIHQLTIKSLQDDAAVRDEINIDLGHHAGDQDAVVGAFVGRMGVEWSGTIEKDLDVWEFPDCEVVHYTASTGSRRVRCVEFEATEKASVDAALAIVARYERATGFDARERERRPLFQMLFPETVTL